MVVTGRLTPDKERELERIIEIIEQDLNYFVNKGPLNNHDMSKIVGYHIEIKLRRGNKEFVRIKTHYESDGERTVTTYDTYYHELDRYNHKIESLNKFLRDNDYVMRRHEEKKKEEEKEEKDKKEKKKKKKK